MWSVKVAQLPVCKVFLLNFLCSDVTPKCCTEWQPSWGCQYIFYWTTTVKWVTRYCHVPSFKTYIYITLMNLIHNNVRNAMKTIFKFPEKNPCKTIVKKQQTVNTWLFLAGNYCKWTLKCMQSCYVCVSSLWLCEEGQWYLKPLMASGWDTVTQ